MFFDYLQDRKDYAINFLNSELTSMETILIDIHCHILWGIDDGPREKTETNEMCRMASDDGIEAIVSTPHSFDGQFQNYPERILSQTDELNEELFEAGINLSVYPGMEIRISPDLIEGINTGKVLPINQGKYILLEFHPFEIPAGFENFASVLVEQGFSLIIAHPEKNIAIQKHPDFLFRIITHFRPWEILSQVTADSLLGQSGTTAYNTAKLLIKNNLAHLIATDAHSALSRPPLLKEAVKKARSLIGEVEADQMANEIPSAILFGTEFPEWREPRNPRLHWWIL